MSILADWLEEMRRTPAKTADGVDGLQCAICNNWIPGATKPRCCDPCRADHDASIERCGLMHKRRGYQEGRAELEAVADSSLCQTGKQWALQELERIKEEEELESIPL